MINVLILVCALMITSCTFNLTNISTHGTASDLVDETSTNDIETTMKIPGGIL